MEHYKINHLRELEAESIFVIREVVAQFEKPVMLFSGGKDSIVSHTTHIRKITPLTRKHRSNHENLDEKRRKERSKKE